MRQVPVRRSRIRQHVNDVLDVFTNLMNFLPDNGVVDVMTMIVEVAKQVAVGALGGLDGLQSMRPGGDFARQMNAGARSGDAKYFAVASSVTPSDPRTASLRRLSRPERTAAGSERLCRADARRVRRKRVRLLSDRGAAPARGRTRGGAHEVPRERRGQGRDSEVVGCDGLRESWNTLISSCE